MVMSTPSSTVYQQSCFRQLRCSLLTTGLQLTMRKSIRDTEETNLAGALSFLSLPFWLYFLLPSWYDFQLPVLSGRPFLPLHPQTTYLVALLAFSPGNETGFIYIHSLTS